MSSENTLDYRQFYDLESYLFDTVRNRFAQQHYLSTFDFFCIVIWKANRAKSKIATKLLQVAKMETLDEAVGKLTREIAACPTAKEKFKCLLGEEWGFRLPMASAILTVLYPEEFTVYDWRVCNLLKFKDISNLSKLDKIWQKYQEFIDRVHNETPQSTIALRDKDRYLWGKSFHDQLMEDIKQGFRKNSPSPETAK